MLGFNLRKKIGDSYAAVAGKVNAARRASGTVVNPIQASTEFDLAFRTSAIARQVVAAPVYDALRNWRTWEADETQREAIEAEEVRLDVRNKVTEALINARLYGGAAILIGTNADEDMSTELDPTTLGQGALMFLTVLRKTKFTTMTIIRDVADPRYGEPETFTAQTDAGSIIIHPSRLVIFRGDTRQTAHEDGDIEAFWGDSVLQSRLTGIQSLLNAYNNTDLLVYEAKNAIVKVPGFMDLLKTPEGQLQIASMLNSVNDMKGNAGLVALDAGMDYTNHNFSFTGLKDILGCFEVRVAGEADIPVSRLFGTSARGLNATGEGDARNYQDRLRGDQTLIIQPAMRVLDACIARSALGNAASDDLTYKWQPLYNPTQQETVDTALKAADLGLKLLDGGLQPTEVEDFLRSVATSAGVIEGAS